MGSNTAHLPSMAPFVLVAATSAAVIWQFARRATKG
jgi:hypothetical protein